MNAQYFDTLRFALPDNVSAQQVRTVALSKEVNLRYFKPFLGGLLGGTGNAAGGGLAGALGGLVGSVLGGGQSAASSTSSGNAGDLLATVFGNQGSARAAEGLGQSTGLGTQGAGNLLGMLLPIVMSFLSQRFLQGGNGTQQLDQALANERQQLNNQGAGGALASLLDQNGDGKLDMNDLVKLGSSLLGGKR